MEDVIQELTRLWSDIPDNPELLDEDNLSDLKSGLNDVITQLQSIKKDGEGSVQDIQSALKKLNEMGL